MARRKIQVGTRVIAKHQLTAIGDPTPVPEGMGGVIDTIDKDSKFGWYGFTFDNGVAMNIHIDNCEVQV